jgi:hypothetical protein
VTARQFNNRNGGDVANDHYRLLAGCVRREETSGRTFYGYSASGVGITPHAENLNGEVPAGSQPIVTVGGEPIYYVFGHSPEAGTIFAPRDKVAIGGFVLPTQADVPVRFHFDLPAGGREEREGRTSRFGEFGMAPVDAGTTPGFLWATADAAAADGKPIRVLGAPNNRYLMFVAAERHEKLELNVQRGQRLAPNERMHLIGVAPEKIVAGRVGYVRITPGMILDQGILPLDAHRSFNLSFSPAQDAVRAGLYQTSSDSAEANAMEGNFQTVLFFLEGRDAAGRAITAHAYFLMKGSTIVETDQAETTRTQFPRWNFNESLPSLRQAGANPPNKGSLDFCKSCHAVDEVIQWRAKPLAFSAWLETMNWHRAKSTDLFWPPEEDVKRLRALSLLGKNSEREIAAERGLVEADCRQCHSLATGEAKTIRYSPAGWRRYLDHRYPPGQTKKIPAQRYGWLRPAIPAFCISCHSTGIMQANPAQRPLAADSRTRLARALADVLDGRSALPAAPGEIGGNGRKLYQETCFQCHSLELNQIVRGARLGKYAPGHLQEKAPGRFSPDDVLRIVDYLARPQ